MLGMAVFTKSTSLIFLPAFIIYTGWLMLPKKRNNNNVMKDAVIFLAPLFIFLILVMGCNYIIYGKLLKFGNREAIGVTGRVLEAPHLLKGLYYYLLSTGKGLFIFNVPLILAVFGLSGRSAKRKKETIFFVLFFISNLLFFIMSFRRGSLFAWGPRYLYPSVAPLLLLAGNFYENNKKLIGRLSMAVLSAAGFLIMTPCMFINQSKFYFFVKERLNLPEYMINFIPDLSPILGAWKMFTSRLVFITKGIDVLFIYSPDYKLIPPVSASMAEYNNFDFWFTKVMAVRPEYTPAVVITCLLLFIAAAVSLVYIIRD